MRIFSCELCDSLTWAVKNGKYCSACNGASKKVYAQFFRASQLGLTEHFTAREWVQLCIRYSDKCARCGYANGRINLIPDHVIPLSKGGTNTIDNIQPLCPRCNTRKRDSSTDYRDDVIELIEVAA